MNKDNDTKQAYDEAWLAQIELRNGMPILSYRRLPGGGYELEPDPDIPNLIQELRRAWSELLTLRSVLPTLLEHERYSLISGAYLCCGGFVGMGHEQGCAWLVAQEALATQEAPHD